MGTVIADFHSLYRAKDSKTNKVASENIGPTSANIGSKEYYFHEGVTFSNAQNKTQAIVIRPFIVEVAPSDEEYMATSPISNVYEFGATPGEALMTYLRLLVDELLWLQKQEQYLSSSLLDDLHHLQEYIRIV